jgi:hypothetical protein
VSDYYEEWMTKALHEAVEWIKPSNALPRIWDKIRRHKMSADYPVITICGSMRYQAEMLEAAKILTGNGYIVLMPFVADYMSGKVADAKKAMLDDMHYAKIDMSVAIYVVGDHRGESTIREIQYAINQEVEVRNWETLH